MRVKVAGVEDKELPSTTEMREIDPPSPRVPSMENGVGLVPKPGAIHRLD